MTNVPAPTVSVVIPVFNRPVVVRRAIESVIAQTYQDFEIIVVDDGSTDETPATLAALTDRRITVIRHKQTRGGSAARNTGIRASSSPYVAFLDSDDEWFPTKLERQLDVFERADEHLALVYAGAERVYADGTVEKSVFGDRPKDLSKVLLTQNVIGETSLGMLRRSALVAVGGFDESLPSCQDLDLWLRICEGFDADLVPEVLVRVAKLDDRVRISSNVSRTVLGREMYRRKHRAQMIRHGVLHLHLRESGWWQQRRVGDSRTARHLYRESLRANPLEPLTYLLLLLTYVPMPWVGLMARCKRLFTPARQPKLWAGRVPDPLTTNGTFQANTRNDSAAS